MLIPELIDKFLAYCSRHRAPATVAFYRTRLKKFCQAYNARDLASLTPLEIDEHLAAAGTGMSDSTRHHDVVALERLQKFALEHKLLDSRCSGTWRNRVSAGGTGYRPLPRRKPSWRRRRRHSG